MAHSPYTGWVHRLEGVGEGLPMDHAATKTLRGTVAANLERMNAQWVC